MACRNLESQQIWKNMRYFVQCVVVAEHFSMEAHIKL